jgi:hypothetical protein
MLFSRDENKAQAHFPALMAELSEEFVRASAFPGMSAVFPFNASYGG